MGSSHAYRLMINGDSSAAVKILQSYGVLGILNKYEDCGKWDISKCLSEIREAIPDCIIRVDEIYNTNQHYTTLYL